MRILFLTDNFPPESNAPATRTWEHAREWVKAGHDVTVITCAPNFPEGRLFDGYKNAWRSRENVDGIDVLRVKSFITANEGFLLRTLDFVSFMITSFFAGLFQKRPNVIVATSPQFFTAVSGWALSAVRRRPFVFELRDIWPASITAVGAMQDSLAIRLLEKLEMFLYRKASSIVAVTKSFKAELVARGVDAGKIRVIENGVDTTVYTPAVDKNQDMVDRYDLHGKFVVGYVGTHGMAHALENIVDAASILRERKDIVFVFAGSGASKGKLSEYVAKKQLDNIRLIDRQPKHLMPGVWALCDVSLVSLKDAKLFTAVIPSKIFESMGMGLPLLLSIPKGEATTIVEATHSGLIVPPENPNDLAAAIVRLADDRTLTETLAKNSLKAASGYSRQTLANRMLNVLVDQGQGR